jgi:integrase
LRLYPKGEGWALPLPQASLRARQARPHQRQNSDGRRIQPKSHMFRNTFAVELLKKRVSLEHVAMLLGDAPDTVREHYYPWVPALQKELERAVKSSWDETGGPLIMDDVDKALAAGGRA